MAHPDEHLDQILVGIDLMFRADNNADPEEFRTQALHVGEHMEALNKALTRGGPLPTAWSQAATTGAGSR